MSYRDSEKAKAQRILNDSIRAKGNGRFGGKRYGFVLEQGELNLWDGIREDALHYFKSKFDRVIESDKRSLCMQVTIQSFYLGFGCCYFLCGERIVMIDGGAPRKINQFIKGIEQLSIRPDQIKLLLLTHGHWDHIGSAKDIRDFTGAKVAMHRQEKGWLENSLKPLPPGVGTWGKTFAKVMGMFMPLVHIPATNVDITLDDSEFPLSDYGIPGKIIYTPGHSAGSVSVLLETGEAFVGDSEMNKLQLRISPGLPIFAEDMQKVVESWKLLIDAGAETIYPAHGDPFPIGFKGISP